MPPARRQAPPHRPPALGPQRATSTARWPGRPDARPLTDAEDALRQLRRRQLARVLVPLLLLALGVYLWAPGRALQPFDTAPPPLRPWALTATHYLILAYPWAKLAALLLLGVLLIHLCTALILFRVQRRNRAAVRWRTLELEIALTAEPSISPASADLFLGFQRLDVPQGRGQGRETALVFALLGGSDGRMRLRVRGPIDTRRDWSSFLRQQIEGCAPGTTLRLVDDDLQIALATAQPGQVLAWSDLMLLRDAAYPLNDLAQFSADPLGPLASALRGGAAIHYAAYEIILRAVERRWKAPLREQVARIQAALSPDDLASHDLLLRKAAQTGYDVVVRCLVIADDAGAARAQLQGMREQLAHYDHTTSGATQRLLIPSVDRLAGGGRGFLISLGVPLPRRQQRTLNLLRAHAHRLAWPGPAWPLPLPGKRRSVMGVFDLAALWHVPDASLDTLLAYRAVRHLPAPGWVFLVGAEAAAAEQRAVLPPPTTPQELGTRRIALAHAPRPDGSLALIGPTIRDLRKGSETLGPMGSGKSCFVETLAVEIARSGGGFGLIDAKGDLADRLLAALPPACHDRVIVVDIGGGVVPCINPMDPRLLREGIPLATLVGQIEQLFARIDPETWPTSMGMQQFARNGLYAQLEGEATPSLVRLDWLYSSRAYRAAVLATTRNLHVKKFWEAEYPAMDLSQTRSIEAFRRRLQRFVTAPLVQQLFCQPESTIYLPDLMDRQQILIVKLVPEAISEELGRIIATTLLASLAAATFARQRREPDPEQRWDWPLIIDEIQKFIDAEHPGDAEVFFTQTRSLGVGIHGAHQGLWQLGEAVQAAALQSLGGLAVLGPIRQDARALVEAYAPHGVSENDFAGLKPREQLLLRFPVHDRDSGLICGIPRERPPAAVPTATERARLEVAARSAACRTVRQRARDAQEASDDALLERAWSSAATKGDDAAVELLLAELEADPVPGAGEDRVGRLRARAAAHRQAQAAALAADPQQIPDVALRLRELSALRYGVDPILSAAAIRVFAQRYPADLPQPRRHARPVPLASGSAAGVPSPDAGTNHGSPTAPATNPAESATVTNTPAQDWLAPPRRVKLE
jgi:hypothetical protein